jgi:hypothetical protein
MCGKRTQATRLNRISVQSFGTNWPLTDQQRRSPLIRFWFDQNIAGRVVLARILWLQGLAEQAWRTVQSAVGDAEALGDRSTLCYALSHGSCVIALWVGNLAAAESYAEMLLDLSRKHGLSMSLPLQVWSERPWLQRHSRGPALCRPTRSRRFPRRRRD